MKTYLYLSTAVAGMMIGGNVWAQCVTTQDCTALGYTESSCPDGNGVKCPFGDKWFCGRSDEQCVEFACDKLGFKYDCVGTNIAGGEGTECNGKYVACKCAEGYQWNNAQQKCEDPYINCVVGALYYSDNTCSSNLESGKTLLGVVIYPRSANVSGWVMTVRPVRTGVEWGGYGTRSGVNDSSIGASCTNTQKLATQSSSYEAAYAAYNYRPTGTPQGKHWCLPSSGLLSTIQGARSIRGEVVGYEGSTLDKINQGIEIAKGEKLGYGAGGWTISVEDICSSTEANNQEIYALAVYKDKTTELRSNLKENANYYASSGVYKNYTLRPVLPFQKR